MDLVFVFDIEALMSLNPELMQSPEDFLLYLEQALESGELTLDEVTNLIRDYNQRS